MEYDILTWYYCIQSYLASYWFQNKENIYIYNVQASVEIYIKIINSFTGHVITYTC